MNAPGFSVTTLVIGAADLHEQAIDLAESFSDQPQCRAPLPGGLNMPQRTPPRADLMMGGFIALIALLGKDAVHDAYTTIIQPRLKPWLERISGMMPGASSQHKAVSVMLYYEEFRVCVRVDSVADTLPAAAKQAHLIEEVHRTALAWIQAHGPQKPVHYYRIEDGQVNAEPVLYDHVLQVK